MQEERDVSNSTIAILLVLTILVSVVGTWTVLEKTKATVNLDGIQSAPSVSGKVTHQEPPEPPQTDVVEEDDKEEDEPTS